MDVMYLVIISKLILFCKAAGVAGKVGFSKAMSAGWIVITICNLILSFVRQPGWLARSGSARPCPLAG